MPLLGSGSLARSLLHRASVYLLPCPSPHLTSPTKTALVTSGRPGTLLCPARYPLHMVSRCIGSMLPLALRLLTAPLIISRSAPRAPCSASNGQRTTIQTSDVACAMSRAVSTWVMGKGAAMLPSAARQITTCHRCQIIALQFTSRHPTTTH
ncbi:hypothetical protein EV126DRAFT_3469 [Verticillium dahliae]|nr:hypothetical protein EV126DRAFT_3469 [Verticillium dahliae]